jgi:hypothetical protein
MSNVILTNLRVEICAFFQDPILQKVNETNKVSIYKCVVNSMLVTSQPKYIVVLVKNDFTPIFEKRNLSDLDWFSFQTRTASKHEKDDLNGLPHCEMPFPTNKSTRFYLLSRPIEKIKQEDFQDVEYISELPIGILCMIEKNSSKVINFQQTSNIERALLYFNTIIYVNE